MLVRISFVYFNFIFNLRVFGVWQTFHMWITAQQILSYLDILCFQKNVTQSNAYLFRSCSHYKSRMLQYDEIRTQHAVTRGLLRVDLIIQALDVVGPLGRSLNCRSMRWLALGAISRFVLNATFIMVENYRNGVQIIILLYN